MKLQILIFMCSLLTGTFASAGNFATDKFKTRNGGELEITFIKHASLMINYNGHIIQVDPISEYANYTDFPKADIILITHEHGDHLDKNAIEASEKPGTILIANVNSQKIIGKGLAMKNGENTSPTNYLTVEAVPAYNTTPGREKFHPRHRDNGYILTLGGTHIYIAGDTEDIPELANLKEIDIAFLPVNQPYTMTVPQAIHAAKMFSPKILYPYHYGDTKIEELAEGLKGTGIDVRIRSME